MRRFMTLCIDALLVFRGQFDGEEKAKKKALCDYIVIE